MKTLIVKNDPAGRKAIYFVDSYKEGQIDAYIDGTIKRVGVDWYALSKPMPDKDVIATIEAYRAKENVPEESIIVRHRLPKGYALHHMSSDMTPIPAPMLPNVDETQDEKLAKQLAQAVKNRKSRRSDAARLRYEQELALTNNVAQPVVQAAEKPIKAVQRNDERMANVRFADMIAHAVAAAVTEALKATH